MKALFPFVLLLFVARLSAGPIETLPKSEVLNVDRTELKLTVKLIGKEETRVLQITAETRFFKDGKYAISEDLAAGDVVFGKVHKRSDGVYEAVRLTIVKAKAPTVVLSPSAQTSRVLALAR